ncbi:MAG: hypothetical protein LBO72_08075 [Helicobacteraceae bacterium]|jgi:hypothetical protein|nr:hypothetical protein [Helicobacteraceae bacterium]
MANKQTAGAALSIAIAVLEIALIAKGAIGEKRNLYVEYETGAKGQ